jgi:hypothetical protein
MAQLRLLPTNVSGSNGKSSRGFSNPSTSTNARSIKSSPSSSQRSTPLGGWPRWSAQVLRIAALHHAAEVLDPNALTLQEAAAARLLARTAARDVDHHPHPAPDPPRRRRRPLRMLLWNEDRDR